MAMKCSTTLRHAGRVWVVAGALGLAACGQDKPQALADAAKVSMAKGDDKAAVVQLKGAVQKDPQSTELRLLLGQAMLGAGDATGAEVELGKALDQKADPDQVVPLLARALLQRGEFRKLTAGYAQTQLKDKEAQASLLTSVSAAWANLNETAKADASLAAALALSPNFKPALLLQARNAVAKQDFKAAGALLDKVVADSARFPEAWLLKGELAAMNDRDVKAAEAAYAKALAFDVDYIPAHMAMVMSRLRENDIPGAKKAAEAAASALPKHPINLLLDAQIAFASANLPLARERIQKLMPLMPRNVLVLQMAGFIASQTGELTQAESHYTKALQIDPGLVQARLGLGETYLRLNQPAKALKTLDALIGADASSADALGQAGRAELALNNMTAASAYFARASKLAPNDSRLETSLALTRLSKGEANTAFAELAAVAAKSKDSVAEQATYAARFERREYEAALASVDKMAAKEPANPAIFEMRGRVYLAKGDLVKAREAYEQQLKLDPTLFAATSNLAALDVLEKKPEQARKRLEDSIEKDPRNYYAMLALAALKAQANAPLEEVRKLYDEAIKVAPQAAEPRLQLIALTLRKRLFKEALVVAQAAAAALPADVNVMDAVGRAQMQAGDVEQATSTFRKMAGIETAAALAYTRLADIYKLSGKRPQAENALKKALEIDPRMAVAKEALIDLLATSDRKADALDFIRKLQQAEPASASGYSYEALYHWRLKDTDAAVAAYKRGLAKTNDTGLAVALYRLLAYSKRGAEADRFSAAWLKDHPGDALLDYVTAENELARKQYVQAEARLVRLVQKFPTATWLLNNLAAVMLVQGKPGALPYAEKAAQLAPTDWRMQDTWASALAAEQQFGKALDVQRKAVELMPTSNDLRLDLAKIALKAGEKSAAKTELDRLSALGAKYERQAEVAALLKSI